MDKAQFFELVHKEIHSRARGTDHCREHLLRQFGEHALWFILLSVSSEQQKRASQSFLGGVKKLIDQVLLHSDVPGKHVRDETVGKGVFRVEDANHLVLINDENVKTLPLGVAGFMGHLYVEWGPLLASAVVSTIPILILFTFLQRFLIKGIMAGAVKG